MGDVKVFADLGGETWRIRRFLSPKDMKWSTFNPSIAYSPVEGYVVLMRSSNYFFDPHNGDTVLTMHTMVKSNMLMANLDSNWQIIEETLREIDFSEVGIRFKRGAEDGRLYWRDGAWEITATIKEPGIELPRIGKFRLDGNKARLIDFYDTPDLQDVEKNWMATYEPNPSFDYVYGPNSVYVAEVGVVEKREMIDAIKDIRGGSPLWDLGEWGYLAIIHEAEDNKVRVYSHKAFAMKQKNIRSYFHRFARYNSEGVLVGLSDRFKLEGVRIEFAAGLVVSGSDVIVSYGFKDVAAYLGKIKLSTVKKMIKDI